jgi:hypothetical protein
LKLSLFHPFTRLTSPDPSALLTLTLTFTPLLSVVVPVRVPATLRLSTPPRFADVTVFEVTVKAPAPESAPLKVALC